MCVCVYVCVCMYTSLFLFLFHIYTHTHTHTHTQTSRRSASRGEQAGDAECRAEGHRGTQEEPGVRFVSVFVYVCLLPFPTSHTHIHIHTHSEYQQLTELKSQQLLELQKFADNDPEKIDRLRECVWVGGCVCVCVGGEGE
jgi:hypothetical protein